ncbi:MAG: M13 family metallopeptidase [Acidobacteriota bacterium]|nr:M13 family metallopeptidase [Acidobacteriota bacterium]
MKLRHSLLAGALGSALVLTVAGAAQTSTHGVAISHIDASVNPGDDFFHYANGTWIKQTEIPADRGSVNVFSLLDNISSKRTSGIIEDVAKSNPAAGSEARKIADLYNSYMDEKAIEDAGLKPVEAQLASIQKIKDKRELAKALGETLRLDVDALNNTNFHTQNLFGLWVAPGFHDTSRYAAYLLQGGLALPDRQYYLSDSKHMQEVREAYLKHVSTVLKLAGYDNPDARAKAIFDLEHAIAEKHSSLAENDDIHKADNTWTAADFAKNAPGLDWREYFRGAGLEKQKSFIVWQPSAFTGESALVASTSLDTWKDWLAYHLLEQYSGVLPKAFADERFAFFGQTLTGTPQQRPRWQRGVGVVSGVLGDAVGKIYAQRYFTPEEKAQVQAMVANIIEAFRQRIDALDWMNPATKAEAKAKLSTLYVGIGYTDKWDDYSGLQIKAGDIVGNLERASLFEYHTWVKRIGAPSDKKAWTMTPQTVNAVNLPLQNAIDFPAAILQPPFYDPEAPAAVNYGAIGAIMGHEISHTFDTEGSTFDSKGALRNWWTPEDLKHFEGATKKLAEQYDTYHPFPDVAVNGEQTLAENIADVAGIAASYDAFHASLKGQPAPEKDGLTGDQQFFLAFGQNYAMVVREASLRRQVAVDSHSPGEYRASTVRNIDAWYKAFNIEAGRKLYLTPEERVRIW